VKLGKKREIGAGGRKRRLGEQERSKKGKDTLKAGVE
jgi:hypothetical protein